MNRFRCIDKDQQGLQSAGSLFDISPNLPGSGWVSEKKTPLNWLDGKSPRTFNGPAYVSWEMAVVLRNRTV